MGSSSGSTCEPTLARRLAAHIGNYIPHKQSNKSSFVTSLKCFENNDYDIILLENWPPCDDKDELHKRERYRNCRMCKKMYAIANISRIGIIIKINKRVRQNI